MQQKKIQPNTTTDRLKHKYYNLITKMIFIPTPFGGAVGSQYPPYCSQMLASHISQF